MVKGKHIIVAVIAVVLIVVGVIFVTGGKLGFGGWRAEVKIVSEYTWEGYKSVKISDVTTYQGIGLNVLPAVFGEDWRLEVTSIKGGETIERVVKGIHVEWSSARTDIINVSIGESETDGPPTGVTIVVRLMYLDGTLIDEESVTI